MLNISWESKGTPPYATFTPQEINKALFRDYENPLVSLNRALLGPYFLGGGLGGGTLGSHEYTLKWHPIEEACKCKKQIKYVVFFMNFLGGILFSFLVFSTLPLKQRSYCSLLQMTFNTFWQSPVALSPVPYDASQITTSKTT